MFDMSLLLHHCIIKLKNVTLYIFHHSFTSIYKIKKFYTYVTPFRLLKIRFLLLLATRRGVQRKYCKQLRQYFVKAATCSSYFSFKTYVELTLFVVIIIQRDCLFNKNLCKKERIHKILIYLLDRPVGRGGGVGEGALAAGVAQEGLVRRPHRHL
jgi:hypothetical protein